MVDYPIDAVIAWVDGEDPAHKSKRKQYGNWAELDNDEVGGDIRFTSVGEIRFCVASLLRFAPFFFIKLTKVETKYAKGPDIKGLVFILAVISATLQSKPIITNISFS